MSSSSSSTHQRSPSFTISSISARSIDDALLSECAALFSAHYGVWSDAVERPLRAASRAKMNVAKMRENLLFDDTCGVVVYKRAGEELVGQAFYCTFTVPGIGDVRWVTQLVVSSQHRRHGIAETMLKCALLNYTDRQLFAAGLVSSHPAAVQALTRASRGVISVANNLKYVRLIHSACTVPYLRASRLEVDEGRCVVDTRFFVDHTEVLAILRQQRPNEWILGELPEGFEFFATAIIPQQPNFG